MTFTTEQLVERWEYLRAIMTNLMGRMSADYTLKKEGQRMRNTGPDVRDVCWPPMRAGI